MKKIYSLIIPAVAALIALSCSEENSVVPNNVTGLRAEPVEGAVILRWNKPAEEDNVLYTSVAFDLMGEKHKRIISNYVDSVLIDGLLARYGAVEYRVCTYSADGTASEEQSLSVQCDPVKKVYKVDYNKDTMKKINMVSMSASACSEYDDSRPENLFDGDKGSIFITPWEDDSMTYPQWLDFGYDDEFNYIEFGFTKRDADNEEYPDEIEIQVSKDGEFYQTVYSISISECCPTGTESYVSSPIKIAEGESFRFIRFNVLNDNQRSHYWTLSEMKMDTWLAPQIVYDPENE